MKNVAGNEDPASARISIGNSQFRIGGREEIIDPWLRNNEKWKQRYLLVAFDYAIRKHGGYLIGRSNIRMSKTFRRNKARVIVDLRSRIFPRSF